VAQRTARDAASRALADSLAALGVMPAALRPDSVAPQFPAGWRYVPPPRAGNRAGMNRFTWNLRSEDAVGFTGMIMWAAGTAGPVIPPGTYTVRLTVGDQPPQTQTFQVRADPRAGASQADLDEQYAFLLRIRDKSNEANNAVRTIRNAKAQLAARRATAGNRSAAFDRLARALEGELSSVEEEIYQVRNRSGQDPLNYPIKLNNQIAALSGVVASAEAKPTKQSYEVFELLSAQLKVQTDRLRPLLGPRLDAVNAELRRLSLEPVVPSTVELVAP
jgi:hypothetical protein